MLIRFLKYAKSLAILILILQLGKNTLGCAISWKYGHRKVFVN